VDEKTLRESLIDLTGKSISELEAILKNDVILPASDRGNITPDDNLYDLTLISGGARMLSVIKLIMDINALCLADAKYMVECAPKLIKKNIDRVTALEVKAKLEAEGAVVEIKEVIEK
jgi:large subunit ribosomal protein L7/L12